MPGDPGRLRPRDDAGRYRMERDHRVGTAPETRCGIRLQGGTGYTHDLTTSSLPSDIAVRSGEITDPIDARSAGRNAERALFAEVGGDNHSTPSEREIIQ